MLKIWKLAAVILAACKTLQKLHIYTFLAFTLHSVTGQLPIFVRFFSFSTFLKRI